MIPATTPPPSELTLDRYLLGEASGEEVLKVNEWLAADPGAAAQLSRRNDQAAAAFAPVPSFNDLSDKVEARRRSNAPAKRLLPVCRTPFAGAALTLFALAATALLVVRPGDVWTAKGGAPYCIVKHDSTIVKVRQTASCTAGDTVQVYCAADELPWVMLLYAERDGAFMPCLKNDTALQMARSPTPAPLPFSLVIDTTKGILDLTVIVSAQPFSADEAIKSLNGKSRNRMRITRYRLMRE